MERISATEIPNPRIPVLIYFLLFTIILTFIAVNARWIYVYRLGQVYNIDESGYLTYALQDYRALICCGPFGWFQQIEAPSYQAPFVTLLTSLVFLVGGPAPIFGFVTMGLAGLATILLGFSLGRYLAGNMTGIYCALLTACDPAILNAVRDYSFAMPATAVLLTATLAMLLSNNFKNLGWTVAFGLAVGLLPLTRTMTIASVPPIGFAALTLAAYSGALRRSLSLLLLAGCVAVTTSAIWLVPNGRYVANYLLQFGYGSRSGVYNPHTAPSIWAHILYMARYLAAYIYCPHFVFIVFDCLAGLFVVGRHFATKPKRFWAIKFGDYAAVVLIVGGYLVVLMTSQNAGAAFATPLVPLLIVLATCSMMKVSRSRGWQATVLMVVAAAAFWPASSMLDLHTRMSWPRNVVLPVLGSTILSNGIGPIEHYELSAGYAGRLPTMPLSGPEGRAWHKALLLSAQNLAAQGGQDEITAFGARGYLFNTNALNFVWMFSGHQNLPMIQATPEVLGDNIIAYEMFLKTGDGSGACQLVTETGSIGEIMPPITNAYMVAAARKTGFIPGPHWTLPDGNEVTLWRRPRATVPCTFREANKTEFHRMTG
jgi:4-amino-4-deoxy-L-arabinose transferase-like glycosyltransferase